MILEVSNRKSGKHLISYNQFKKYVTFVIELEYDLTLLPAALPAYISVIAVEYIPYKHANNKLKRLNRKSIHLKPILTWT